MLYNKSSILKEKTQCRRYKFILCFTFAEIETFSYSTKRYRFRINFSTISNIDRVLHVGNSKIRRE